MRDAPMTPAKPVRYACTISLVHRLDLSETPYPFRMAGSPLASPLTTLNILIVLSDEQVARRLP